MTVQILAMTSLNPGAESALNEYLSVVGPLMESAGAKLIKRFEVSKDLVGQNEFQFVTLVEYPDEEAVKKVFDSDAYESLAQIKQLAFSSYQISTVVNAG